MVKAKKNEDVRARVDAWTRSNLEHLAAREDLDISDLIRKALREFIERKTRTQEA